MRGVIDKIWDNKTKNGKKYWVLSIGGENYSVWDKKYMQGIQEGSEVEYEWSQSGDFRKISDLRKTNQQVELDPEERGMDRNQHIIRMSCIKSATTLICDSEADDVEEKGDMALTLARKFEKYVTKGNKEERGNARSQE